MGYLCIRHRRSMLIFIFIFFFIPPPRRFSETLKYVFLQKMFFTQKLKTSVVRREESHSDK